MIVCIRKKGCVGRVHTLRTPNPLFFFQKQGIFTNFVQCAMMQRVQNNRILYGNFAVYVPRLGLLYGRLPSNT